MKRAWGRESRVIFCFHTKNTFAMKTKILKLRVFIIPAMEWKAEGNLQILPPGTFSVKTYGS